MMKNNSNFAGFWRIFLINISMLFCVGALAQTPEEVAKKVSDKIVESTSFEFVNVPANWSQKNAYIIRFTSFDVRAHNTYEAKTYVKYQANKTENHLGQRNNTRLSLSHSPGKLKVFINENMVFESNAKIAQTFEQLDYQLNRFASNIPHKFVNGDSIRLEFTPFDNKPNIKIAPTYAQSGMAANKFGFKVSIGDETAPFAIKMPQNLSDTNEGSQKWQLQQSPTTRYLRDKLAFSDFRYFTGTFVDAMQLVSNSFDALDYQAYINAHKAFFFDNYESIKAERESKGLLAGPFDHADRFLLLDDFGPQLVPLINAMTVSEETDPYRDRIQNLLMQAVDTIQNKVPRLEDGTLSRLTPYKLTVQSDDLFMGGLFLIRASEYLQDQNLLEDAVTQTLNFHKYLFDEATGLYRHGYFANTQTQSSTIWGRGVGWMAMVYVELLTVLPESHPQYQQILDNFKTFSQAMLDHQNKTDGRWHQVLNDTSSYLETSVTAMFLRALATGVHKGWLREPKYKEAALLAWQGLNSQISSEGDVTGIVRGTPIFGSAEAYKSHKPRKNDPRGLGAVLYASVAMHNMLGH